MGYLKVWVILAEAMRNWNEGVVAVPRNPKG